MKKNLNLRFVTEATLIAMTALSSTISSAINVGGGNPSPVVLPSAPIQTRVRNALWLGDYSLVKRSEAIESGFDLMPILLNDTGTQKTEVHAISMASSFTQFNQHSRTPLDYADENSTFFSEDSDQGKIPGIYRVKSTATTTRMVEIDYCEAGTYDYPSCKNFVSGIAQTLSADSQYVLFPWLGMGPDLVRIHRQGLNGKIDIDVYSFASGWKTRSIHNKVLDVGANDGYSTFVLFQRRDGTKRIAKIQQANTESGRVELSVISMGDNIKLFEKVPTEFLPSSQKWATYTLGDLDGDSYLDLVQIKAFDQLGLMVRSGNVKAGKTPLAEVMYSNNSLPYFRDPQQKVQMILSRKLQYPKGR